MFVKGNTVGSETRFGDSWSGQRCGSKTRSRNLCRRPAYKTKGRCALHGALATGPKTEQGRSIGDVKAPNCLLHSNPLNTSKCKHP